ncbi:MAG: hypothetical protein AAGE01_19650 [Pseudomonadota bacterium]
MNLNLEIGNLQRGGQLFLNAVRCMAAGDLAKPTVHVSVHRTFCAHQFAEGLSIIGGTLSAISACSCRTIVFNDAEASAVLPDETAIVHCLAALQEQPEQCACRYVHHLVEEPYLGVVMPFLIGTARVFATRRLLFAPDPRTTAAADRPALYCVH